MNWLQKVAEVKITRLFQHGNVFGFFAYKFPKHADQIKDMVVVEVGEDEWQKNSFTGYGYFIIPENINNIKQNVAQTPPAMLEMYKKMPLYSEIKRDLYILELYEKFKQVPFFIIKPGNESYLIHEGAHQIWEFIEDKESIALPDFQTEDNDEYMNSESERFAYMTEMEYFKSQGISFDDYFKQSFPEQYDHLYDPNTDPESKRLSLMDYRDHKQIWDFI